jgi:hypothetical protein
MEKIMKWLNKSIRRLFPKFQPISKYNKEISKLSKDKMELRKMVLSLIDKNQRYREQLKIDAKFKDMVKARAPELRKEIAIELEKENRQRDDERIIALQKFINETASDTGYTKIYLRKIAIRNLRRISEKRKRNEINKLGD